MVLTQSCDLVRRGKQPPKTPYITIAAVRPLSILLNRRLEIYLHNSKDKAKIPLLICKKKKEAEARQFLERLLHNTEPGYFFIGKGGHPSLEDNYCTFLTLSIALRAQHYDACLSAKIAQLKEVFQAKVGWMTGNLYSRVGTPDFEEHEHDPNAFKESFFQDVLYKETAWLSADQRRQLLKRVGEEKPTGVGEVRDMVTGLQKDVEFAAERVVSMLKEASCLANTSDDALKQAVSLLVSDPVFQRHVTGSAGDG